MSGEARKWRCQQAGTCLPASDHAIHDLKHERGCQSDSCQLGCSKACFCCVPHCFGLAQAARAARPVARHCRGRAASLPGGDPWALLRGCPDRSTRLARGCTGKRVRKRGKVRATWNSGSAARCRETPNLCDRSGRRRRKLYRIKDRVFGKMACCCGKLIHSAPAHSGSLHDRYEH